MLLVCPGATRKDGRVRVTGAMVRVTQHRDIV